MRKERKMETVKTTIKINNGEDVISISEFGYAAIGQIANKDEVIEGYKIQTGTHVECGGTLTIINTKRYKVLHCHACGLRLKFPVEIGDGATLKRYFENG